MIFLVFEYAFLCYVLLSLGYQELFLLLLFVNIQWL